VLLHEKIFTLASTAQLGSLEFPCKISAFLQRRHIKETNTLSPIAFLSSLVTDIRVVPSQQTFILAQTCTMEAIRLTDQLEKPELDDRQYRVIQLKGNGIEILLIHDSNTDKASASATVSAGSFSDGDLPGAAHAVMVCSPLFRK
jgi:hypothetical protein